MERNISMFSSTALANWFLCHSWAYITETRSTKRNSNVLTNRLYLVMSSYSFYTGALFTFSRGVGLPGDLEGGQLSLPGGHDEPQPRVHRRGQIQMLCLSGKITNIWRSPLLYNNLNNCCSLVKQA